MNNLEEALNEAIENGDIVIVDAEYIGSLMEYMS